MAAVAALAFWAKPVAHGDSATVPDQGAGAANAAGEVVARDSGIDAPAPAGTGGRRWSGVSWIDETSG